MQPEQLLKATLEEMRQMSARICRDYLTGKWKSINADDIVFRRISGGLSNFLYYVSLPVSGNDNNGNTNPSTSTGVVSPNTNITLSKSKRVRKDSGQKSFEPKEVLLRIYGQTHGSDLLETMVTESVVFALLSERNLGPKLLGIFPGGRIEEFIQARPLQTKQLSDYKISMRIAEKMAEIHSLEIPVSKEPQWLWKSMDRWILSTQAILENSTNNQEFQEQIKQIQEIDFVKEMNWLREIILKGNFPVVFCHNDLQEGNILLKEDPAEVDSNCSSLHSLSHAFEDSVIKDDPLVDEGIRMSASRSPNRVGRKRYHSSASDHENYEASETQDSVISNNSMMTEPDLIIIDFEYCAYNYRGFDLANHFVEWIFDYTNTSHPFYFHYKQQYPTKEQSREFICTYLRKLNELDDDIIVSEGNYTPSTEEIDGVEKEVRVFTLVSHLFWSLWAIVNVHQNIEFGYWDYAISRLNDYKEKKAAYLAEVKEQ
ncbi:CHKA family protein [Megaselia abdita]